MSGRGDARSTARGDRKARVLREFGLARLHAIAKDDVVAALIASDHSPDAREALFRDWCAVVWASVQRSDLHRVRTGSTRELNRSLF